MWSRRRFLGAGLSALAGCALPRLGRAPSGTSSRRPRYFVNVLLNGGIDAISTLDPKNRGDVEPWVDVPYGQSDILTLGDVPVGPNLKSFVRQKGLPPIAVLLGVRLETGNHHTGHAQHVRMRTNVSPHMPSLFDVIGSHRDGQPLGTIAFGASEQLYSPGWFGGDILASLDRTPRPALKAMAGALRRQSSDLQGSARMDEALTTASSLDSAADLFDRLQTIAPFALDLSWPAGSDRFQLALWAIDNDLASCLYITAQADFDTHIQNASRQQHAADQCLPALARFLSELSRRTNRFGPLSDNCVVVAGSEIGRLPRLNEFGGKDHFPEAPFLFCGRSINTRGARGAVHGHTGTSMEALPISLQTGRPAGGGQPIFLDDVGTTLLRLAGIDPAPHGYRGRTLEFLLA